MSAVRSCHRPPHEAHQNGCAFFIVFRLFLQKNVKIVKIQNGFTEIKKEYLISYGQRLYLLIGSGDLSTEVKKYDFISKYSDFRQSGHEYGVTVSMDWQ
ncbi:MAG: hypothetical protein DBY44_02585 [Veillonellaceae bacterium]|nr:MAG: hypothetical protein DBY44_02585 [Veillonellaceae bacterium]